MNDPFFTKTNCDRCGASLSGGRTMSMFNEDCICMECARKERQEENYRAACDAERAAYMGGNRNFKGIGWRR